MNLKEYCENHKHCPYGNHEWKSSVNSWVRVSTNNWKYALCEDLE